MRRRQLLTSAVPATVLMAPRIARAQAIRSLRFVPLTPLNVLDPIFVASLPTRNHAFMVFDTLYGQDPALRPQPQMASGHTIDDNGLTWTIRLRDGLAFHDGSPVLARDAVASIRRWAARDSFGQELMAATAELTAPDDKTIRFRLHRRFPHLALSLSGATLVTPVIMPERLAMTDPFKPVPEIVGSGPYRFLPSAFVESSRAEYERFSGYQPRTDGKPGYLAGPKIAHLDRVIWTSIGDAGTAVAALRTGEVDWVEAPAPDLLPMLAANSKIVLEVNDPWGAMGVMRFNQLLPPFNNPAIRRALLGAVDQAAAMQALAGNDPALWKDGVGVFVPGTPCANDAGIGTAASPPDYAKVKRDLAEAGYQGERVVVLGTSGPGFVPPMSEAGAAQLRAAGINVDFQVSDFGTMIRRIQNKGPADQGGWNVYFFPADAVFNQSPATYAFLRGIGAKGAPGWPDSPRIEELRAAWLGTDDPAESMRICRSLQEQVWRDVPFIPMGSWLRKTAFRRGLVDRPVGFPLFWGIRWA